MRYIILLPLLFSLTACSTIQFSQTDTYSEEVTSASWHHGGIFGLVEFSDPVNLKQACDGKELKTFTTEQTFLQGLVSGVTYSLYTPRNVAVACQ